MQAPVMVMAVRPDLRIMIVLVLMGMTIMLPVAAVAVAAAVQDVERLISDPAAAVAAAAVAAAKALLTIREQNIAHQIAGVVVWAVAAQPAVVISQEIQAEEL